MKLMLLLITLSLYTEYELHFTPNTSEIQHKLGNNYNNLNRVVSSKNNFTKFLPFLFSIMGEVLFPTSSNYNFA